MTVDGFEGRPWVMVHWMKAIAMQNKSSWVASV